VTAPLPRRAAAARWLDLVVVVTVVVALAGLLAHADCQSAAGAAVLGFPWPPAERVISAGERIEGIAARHFGSIRAGLVLGLVAHFVFARRRRRVGPNPGTTPRWGGILPAVCLGWLAQTYVLVDATGMGLALYGLAGYVYLRGPRPPDAPRVPIGVCHAAAFAALVIGFIFVALYGVDVYPETHYDEAGFALAAGMDAGHVPAGRVYAYRLERFQGLPAPFALHALALEHFTPGIIALRFVSIAAAVGTLLIAALVLRARLGPRATLWMLGFTAISPLFLNHARTAQFIMVTVLHGAASLAALLRFRERPDWRSGLVLAVLAGGSIYFYQLSWFVPVLLGGGLGRGRTLARARMAAPRRGHRRHGAGDGASGSHPREARARGGEQTDVRPPRRVEPMGRRKGRCARRIRRPRGSAVGRCRGAGGHPCHARRRGAWRRGAQASGRSGAHSAVWLSRQRARRAGPLAGCVVDVARHAAERRDALE
jgi:hypothetical protein